MARRVDLLVEADTTLDGSGTYASDWIDTSGVYTVRVVSNLPGETYVVQSADQTNALASTLANGVDVPITARYLRVEVGAPSQANADYRVTIRSV